jgi:hypothetical protein
MGDGSTHEPDAFGEDDDAVPDSDPDGPVDADPTAGHDRRSPDSDGPVDADPTAGQDRPSPDSDGPARPEATTPARPDPVERPFDWRGWVLVVAVAVCFLVIPGVILAYPYVGERFGLPFYHTYLVLPMIPAVLLAVLAVWAATPR